ncbi:hypothetical protein [Thalassospira sp. MCCC 1A01428]|jgi:hypothetical protein|uniref:hypothetical protein n=1 Tax=Thalassospira sp. MCCC 1A01428 TaxID=1470575 RepID=UPI000A1F6582|nr:hypothetical protein [Thalassospira sp. MCCC 1A01428]OSQ38663.1 hypothetical protein THS27_21935 [Thalassospira sp. MCCC 1A01428]|tara:strand:+ start:11754 stop:12182 length:429 start_codon:yes stop_codon:yes gene_type:complete
MGKDPFDVLDDTEELTLDVSAFRRTDKPTVQTASRESTVPVRIKPSQADIAREAAKDGFTTRDGTGKIDGRSLRRSGRTALLSVRVTPDCKQLIEDIVASRGKGAKAGEFLSEMLQLWVETKGETWQISKLTELDIHGQSRD